MAKKRRGGAKKISAARQTLKRAKAAHHTKHRAIVARDVKLRAVKKRFFEAHRSANNDLAEGDYDGMERAIQQEADAIEEFREVTEAPLPSSAKPRRQSRTRRSG
jgi:hypothetical protein